MMMDSVLRQKQIIESIKDYIHNGEVDLSKFRKERHSDYNLINYYFGSIDNLLKQLDVNKSVTSYGGASLRNQLALTFLDDLREQGYTYQEIADKYKVSRTAINNLHNKLKKSCEK
jgi:hypothetical protein